MKIVIIDYESGNLHSVEAAFRRVLDKHHSNSDISLLVSSNPEDLKNASHIVLPGVGAFADCMSGLQAVDGMVEELNHQVIDNKKPLFGICVGMQMMMERGFEYGEHQGLGWIKGDVVKINSDDKSLKVPHMGWNDLLVSEASKETLFSGVENGEHAYFVHSYHVQCAEKSNIMATINYGDDIVAAIGRGNIFGTQFHPEKSQEVGEKIINNFINLS